MRSLRCWLATGEGWGWFAAASGVVLVAGAALWLLVWWLPMKGRSLTTRDRYMRLLGFVALLGFIALHVARLS